MCLAQPLKDEQRIENVIILEFDLMVMGSTNDGSSYQWDLLPTHLMDVIETPDVTCLWQWYKLNVLSKPFSQENLKKVKLALEASLADWIDISTDRTSYA